MNNISTYFVSISTNSKQMYYPLSLSVNIIYTLCIIIKFNHYIHINQELNYLICIRYIVTFALDIIIIIIIYYYLSLLLLFI